MVQRVGDLLLMRSRGPGIRLTRRIFLPGRICRRRLLAARVLLVGRHRLSRCVLTSGCLRLTRRIWLPIRSFGPRRFCCPAGSFCPMDSADHQASGLKQSAVRQGLSAPMDSAGHQASVAEGRLLPGGSFCPDGFC